MIGFAHARLLGVMAIALWSACFSAGSSLAQTSDPPNIDEVEAFEQRLRVVVPKGWELEPYTDAISPTHAPWPSKPYLKDWDRAWVLSVVIPSQNNQRVEIFLHLVRQLPSSLPSGKEMIGKFERFYLVAQNPNVISINGVPGSWSTLPGWQSARSDLLAAFDN